MRLDDYLTRIGYSGPAKPDLETLRALVTAHVLSVPFENLDVQLGRTVDLDPARIFDKIVGGRRGGWCYEMNGIFGWALAEIGFDVMRLSAGVMRETAGDAQLGNHLCLAVKLDGTDWLVDVGFGGSLLTPLRFDERVETQAPYRVGLKRAPGGYWRFYEDAGDGPFGFDVALAPADEALLARKSEEQRTAPNSPFVMNLVAQRRLPDRHLSLRGRVLKTVSAEGAEKRLVDDADELVAVLSERFGLDLPEAAGLWPAIHARHEELFGQRETRTR